MRIPEGSIKKTKDGKRWVVRVRSTVDGRRRSRTQICRTYALAKTALAQILETLPHSGSVVTFADLHAFYCREYIRPAHFVGGRKVSGYRQNLNAVRLYADRALAFFGRRELSSISYADLRAYKIEIEALPARGKPRSVADVNHHLKYVRRMFNIAIEQGWVDKSPFRSGSKLIIETFETHRTRILDRLEEKRLLAACDNEHRRHLVPIIIFALETACRRGEIVAARWHDVNFEGRYLRIEAANSKTLKPRLVPITERLRVELERIPRTNGRIFRISDFKRSFAGACRDAQLLDLRFHDLRHTAITRMLEAGISPAIVMKVSGHSQEKTFLRYVNQNEANILDVAIRLDRAA